MPERISTIPKRHLSYAKVAGCRRFARARGVFYINDDGAEEVESAPEPLVP